MEGEKVPIQKTQSTAQKNMLEGFLEGCESWAKGLNEQPKRMRRLIERYNSPNIEGISSSSWLPCVVRETFVCTTFIEKSLDIGVIKYDNTKSS